MVNDHFPFEMAMIGGYTPCSNRPISSCFNLLEFLYRKWPNPLVPWSNPTIQARWDHRSPNQMALGGNANLNKPKYHIISKLVPTGFVSIWFDRHCCPINIIHAGQVTLWQSNMVCRKTAHLVGWCSRLTAHSVPGFPSLFDYQEGKPNCCLYTIIPHNIPGISQNILYPRYLPIISHYTSSTAQDGGASFKDRKPIQDS